MRTKKEQPKFYAFIINFNTDKVEPIDVMSYLCSIPMKRMVYWKWHDREYKQDIKLKDCTYEQAKQVISGKFGHMYWGRYEYEVDVTRHCELSWAVDKTKGMLSTNEISTAEEALDCIEKTPQICIDVYDQIMMNIDLVTKMYLEYKGLYKKILKNK